MAAVVSKTNEKGPVMFSYSDSDGLATYVYEYLKKKLLWPVWMDKHDAKSSSLSSSTADAVEKCCAVVCFVTPVYQDTPVCERELTYAANLGKPIVPCIVGSINSFDGCDNDGDDDDDDDDDDEDDDDWVPTGWLGILVADFDIVNFRGVTKDNVDQKCEELFKKLQNKLPNKPTK